MQLEGLKPFTPTRIEWLTLILQATNFLQYSFMHSISKIKVTSIDMDITYEGIPSTHTLQPNLILSDNKTQMNVIYQGISENNTIVIILKHTEDIEAETLSEIMKILRKRVFYLAKSLGWDTWIKVEEIIEVIGNKKDSDLQDN